MSGVLVIAWMSAVGAVEILIWKTMGMDVAVNVGLGIFIVSALVFGYIYKRMADDLA